VRSLAWLCVLVPLAAAGQAPDFSRLVREQAPAVVSIAATYSTPPVIPDVPHDEPVLGLFEWVASGPAPGFDTLLLGTGFIVSSDGDIVTARHVVEHAFNNEVVVRLADGRELVGQVAGSDRASDIALVRIRAAGLPKVRIGDPARVQPGHWAVTIGAPFGFEQTVAAGVVSTTTRAILSESRFRFIQTDSATNPGHSGGPLFNLAGEVIGVNSRMFSPGSGSIGLSFAVPIDLAMKVVEQLRASGAVPRGHLGLSVQEVSAELARAFRLERSAGALVTSVEPRGPAEHAGLRAGDVLFRIAGKAVEAPPDLMAIVDEIPPGSGFVIELMRDGKAERAIVQSALSDDGRDRRIDTGDTDRLGLRLLPLGENQRRRLAVPGGAVVQRSEGAARLAGVHAGDIVLALNGRPVLTPAELLATLAKARPGEAVALLVDRMGSRAFVALRIP
jgi:serine protease Do